MADAGGLNVGMLWAQIGVDTSALKSGLADVDKSMEKTASGAKQSAEKASTSWSGVGKALGGLAIAKFATDSVSAFAAAQQSTVALQDAFARFPKLSDSSATSIGKISQALADKSRFDSGAIKTGAAVLAQFGLTGRQVEATLPALVDYAAKTGKDIPAAAVALQKAALGSTKPLKDLGITGFKATGDRAKDMATVLGLVGQKTRGFAETDVHSVEGGLAVLQKNFTNVKEAVGEALVPALTAVTPAITAVATAAQKGAAFFGALPGPLRAAGIAIAGIYAVAKIGLFSKLTAGFATFRTNMASLRTANAAATAGAAGMTRFGAAARAAGMSVGAMGKGIMGAFGGPIGLALVGITAAVGLWQSANEKSTAAVEAHKTAVDDLAATMNVATGAFTSLTIAEVTKDLEDSDAAFRAVGSSSGEMAADVIKGGAALDVARNQLQKLDGGLAATNINTGRAGFYVKAWAAQVGVSFSTMAQAAIKGGATQAKMADQVRAAGGDVGKFNDQMGDYRRRFEEAYPGLEKLRDLNEKTGEAAEKNVRHFDNEARAVAKLVNVDPVKLVNGLNAAAKAGDSAESALKKLHITGAAAKQIIDGMPDLKQAGDGMHYFSQEAADAAPSMDKLAESTDSVAEASKKLQASLDGYTAGAGRADTATQFLQLTLDRLAGRSQQATDAHRLLETSMRAIVQTARAEAAAHDDVTSAQLKLSEAKAQGVDKDHSAVENALAVSKAERDVKDAIDKVTDSQNGRTDANTAAARSIEQQVSATAEAAKRIAKLHGAVDPIAVGAEAGAKRMDQLRKSFVAQQIVAGKTPKQAKAIADSYALIPKFVRTSMLAENHATPKIGDVSKELAKLPLKVQTNILAKNKTEKEVAAAVKRFNDIKDRNALLKATDQTAPGVRTAKGKIATIGDWVAKVTAKDLTGGGVGTAKTKVGSVPDKDVTIHATDNTQSGVDSAIGQLNRVPAQTNAGLTITTNYVEVGTKPAPGLLGRVGVTVPAGAKGGALTGGVAGKDSILMYGMPGEHMLTTRDVNKLGGQAGVYRFRAALTAGQVPKYAGGGAVPAGTGLAGIPAFQPGDREGNVVGALGDLASAVADFAQAAADARGAASEARGKLSEAQTSQRQTKADQKSNVADVKRKDAERLKAAEDALTAARHRSAKTAAAQASKHDAIVKAEAKLTKVRHDNAAALAEATAAQTKANNAETAKVKAAQHAYDVDKRAADQATRRAAAEANVQAREAGMRHTLITLGRQYDQNAAKVANLSDKLTDLQGKAADTTNSIAGNVAGIGGGILGSDAFTGSSTNAADMIKSLQQNLATAKGFDANIAKLVALGLNPAQAEKVANADIEGRGGVVASALAGASKAQIAQINSLLKQESGVGTATGKRVANAEYGAEIHATDVQIKATQLNMKIEAAEAKTIGDTIAKATRAAMLGQTVKITIGAKELNGVIAAVVKTEHSAEVRHAAGRR